MKATSLPIRTSHRLARTYATATTQKPLLVQPESPRFIDIPKPPQEHLTTRPESKGFLPVPRRKFVGRMSVTDNVKASLQSATRGKQSVPASAPQNRVTWQKKMTVLRKQNLIEGSLELKHRKDSFERMRNENQARRKVEREALLSAPIREDERLTAQSNNFDVRKVLNTKLKASPQAIIRSQIRHSKATQAKLNERMSHLHTLYSKAHNFIVTNDQLDEAIETAFGTDESPVYFVSDYTRREDAHSVWAYGKPQTLQDRAHNLDRQGKPAHRGGPSIQATDKINTERINRIAEELTGGDFGPDLLKPVEKTP